MPTPEPLDEARLEQTERRLCNIFNLPSLYDHQRQPGRLILSGRSVILDVPTGGGKTVAFLYALFYHWWLGKVEADENAKILFIISPLIALMQAQVCPQPSDRHK